MDERIVCGPAIEHLEVHDEPYGKTLWTSMEENGPKLALVEVETGLTVTYDQLKTRATLAAKRLVVHGCRQGDVLAIFAPNSVAWVVAYLATCRLGAIPAGISCLLTVDELRHQLRTCQAKFVFTTQALANGVLRAATGLEVQATLLSGSDHPGCVDIEDAHCVKEQLPSCLSSFESMNIKPADPAGIYFSGGTTGPQKGVLLSHRNSQLVYAIIRHPSIAAVWPVQLSFAPLSHLSGNNITFWAFAAGFTTYMMSKFDLEAFLRTLDEQKMEGVIVVPPLVTMMVKSPVSEKYKLSSLRHMIVGGASLSADLENRIRQKYPGITVRQNLDRIKSTPIV
jgi:acyl-CoA synthetase (AMP-forming)/AMP-acid ligase II